jgi:hypothetical protein
VAQSGRELMMAERQERDDFERFTRGTTLQEVL